VDDFYAFLNKYPSGFITEQAQFAIDQLQKAKVFAQEDKNGIIQTPGAKRFRVGDEVTYVTIDNNTGQEVRKSTLIVYKIQFGFVYIKTEDGEEVRTEDGASVKLYATDGMFSYDPPLPYQPGDDFIIGKKWTTKTLNTINNMQNKNKYKKVMI
jgi:hypothetical protein